MALATFVTVRKFPNVKESVPYREGMSVMDALKASGLDFNGFEYRLNAEKNVPADRMVTAGDTIYLVKATVGA